MKYALSSIDWRDRIKVGDIVRTVAGTERVVRAVKMRANGLLLYGVTFSIMRCSWTRRCYTVLTRCDLGVCGYAPTGYRYRLKDHGMDRRIDREIRGSFMPNKIKVHCCDVEGIR